MSFLVPSRYTALFQLFNNVKRRYVSTELLYLSRDDFWLRYFVLFKILLLLANPGQEIWRHQRTTLKHFARISIFNLTDINNLKLKKKRLSMKMILKWKVCSSFCLWLILIYRWKFVVVTFCVIDFMRLFEYFFCMIKRL